MSLREHLKQTVRNLTVALEDLKENPARQILIDGAAPLVYSPDLSAKDRAAEAANTAAAFSTGTATHSSGTAISGSPSVLRSASASPSLSPSSSSPLSSPVSSFASSSVSPPQATPNVVHKDLPANMSCQLCPDRIYAVRRYLVRGRLPALVLRYNYPIDERSEGLPDRSDRSLFATMEEEELFSRMLGAADLRLDDLCYQEFPACHFDPRSLPEEWNRRTENCLKHLRETVQRENIRFLLITGAAAVLLFGDRAKALAESSKVVDFPVTDSLSLPCLVVRSPAALMAMERQRVKTEKALERFAEAWQLYQALKGKSAELRARMEAILQALPESASGQERVIANVKLKSASSIKEKGKGDANEERFRAAGREGDALLWKLLVLRETEVRVKKQIVDSLKAMKSRIVP